MSVINTKEGIKINSTHVVQYTKLRGGQTKILLSTGGEIDVEPHEDLDEVFLPIVPANPGFVAVFPSLLADGSFLYEHHSVIAWKLYSSGIYPVFEGYDDGEGGTYEVMIDPSGGIFDADRNSYETLEAWKREFEAKASTSVIVSSREAA